MQKKLTHPAESGGGENEKRASMLPIFLIVLVDVFGMTLVLPLLAIYAERFGASPLEATMLVSIYAACQFISSPFLGHVSDKTGRKPMLIVSQIGTLIGFIILARAQTLLMIYVSRIIDGFTAGNISLAQAYISDNTDAKNRTRSFGLIGIAFGIGYFIGPSLSGFLAGRYGITAPIYLAAFMSFLSICCTVLLLREKKEQRQGAPQFPELKKVLASALNMKAHVSYFNRPVLGSFLYQFLCHMVSFSIFTSGFALFAERRFTWDGRPFGPTEIGYFMGIIGFISMLIQGGLIGRLSSKYGDKALARTGFLTLGTANLLLALTSSVPLLLVVAVTSAIGSGFLRPTLMSLITQSADKDEHGTVTGVSQSINSVTSILCPILGGTLIEHGLLSAWAFTAAVAAYLGLVLAARKRA